MIGTLGLIVGGLLGLAIATTVALWGAVDTLHSRRAARRERLPPMLVVRPVRGLDPGLDDNVAAALGQRYPGALETIFVLDDPDDPAYAVVRRRVEAGSAHARVVIAGSIRPGRTGKLHAMIEGMRAGRFRAPLVCFADSDTRPHPTLLAALARAVLADADVGAAFAPAVSVARPRTAGDVGYGLLLDGIYGPQAALAMARTGSLPFIMGQTMVLRRRALAAAGGLEASTGQLVDDMDIGARIVRAGFRNVLVGPPVPVRSQGLRWSAFRALALRWMAYSRTGIPLWPFGAPATVLEVSFHVSLFAAATAAVLGAPGPAVLFGLVALAVPAGLQLLRRRQGAALVPWRLAWALPVALWLTPLLFVEARLARSVEWRGRRYALDSAGHLAPESYAGGRGVSRLRAGPGERWRRAPG